jgi:hypothetical protein
MDKDKRERRDHHNSLIESEISIRTYNTAYGLRKAREFWCAFYDHWREMETNEGNLAHGGFRRSNHKARPLTDRNYSHWCRNLKKGQLISACYDGKRGRAVDARVIKSRKGVVIAEFVRWGRNSLTRVRFVDGGGWDIDGDYMPAIGVSNRGDYYQIIPHIPHNPNSAAVAVVAKAAELMSS